MSKSNVLDEFAASLRAELGVSTQFTSTDT